MSTATTTAFYNQGAGRKGQPWMMYPVFIWAASTALFYLFGGGKGIGADQRNGQRLMGFNTTVPTADDTELKRQGIDQSAYGAKAQGGQVLSVFSNTKKAPTANQLQSFPTEESTAAAASYTPTANVPNSTDPALTSTSPYSTNPRTRKASRTRKGSSHSNYQYVPAQPHYVNSSQTANGLEPQLSTDQSTRQAGQRSPETGQEPEASDRKLGASNQTSKATGSQLHNFIQLDDQATASRLNEVTPSSLVESAFNTAPVGSNRQQGVASSLQSAGSNKRSVVTLIPAVVRDDQSVKAGQPVKLRLTRAVVIDGIRIPANTVVHAICMPEGDRLRLVVKSLQLGSQLIPLDLEAVDMDGGTGLNAPGLSDQLGGQLKSSAVQGVNIPTRSMLVNTVLNAARFSASSQVRQTQIHLKGGYQLHLKSI